MAAAGMRVLVVDDIADTREHISKLISFEPDMQVVGMAANGLEALEQALELQPDVVLMDINMPGMDGIEATEQLARRVPRAAVVMISIQADADYLRRSMLAGAREFLVKPFGADELVASLRAVHERSASRQSEPVAVPVGPVRPAAPAHDDKTGTVVALFSAKGGVGRSTLAVNLAVAAATELKKSVALLDACYQFGDVALLMNLDPRNSSIADVLADLGDGNEEAVDGALVSHSSGVKVLLPPPSPEVAELVTPRYTRTIIERLREKNELVLVDSASLLQEPALTILDVADIVLCVLTLDLTSIKNTRQLLALADKLGYGDGKLKVVLNRADSAYGITLAEVERSIGRKVDHAIVSDARLVINGLNRGVPFYSLSANAQISRDVLGVARALVGESVTAETSTAKPRAPQRRLAFARR
jgi:pilus assembly protein CpaE